MTCRVPEKLREITGEFSTLASALRAFFKDIFVKNLEDKFPEVLQEVLEMEMFNGN